MSLKDSINDYQDAIARIGGLITSNQYDTLAEVALLLAQEDPALFNELVDRTLLGKLLGSDPVFVKVADSLAQRTENSYGMVGMVISGDSDKMLALSVEQHEKLAEILTYISDAYGIEGVMALVKTCPNCTVPVVTEEELDTLRKDIFDEVTDAVWVASTATECEMYLHVNNKKT